jgi:hypothetical protein
MILLGKIEEISIEEVEDSLEVIEILQETKINLAEKVVQNKIRIKR